MAPAISMVIFRLDLLSPLKYYRYSDSTLGQQRSGLHTRYSVAARSSRPTERQVQLSLADVCPPDDENLLDNPEDLALDIKTILGGGPHAAEVLARLLLSFRRAIGSGLEGINRTSNTLLALVELIYLHSNAHAAALRLYLLAQHGELKVEDEPLNLINAAVERSTARVSQKSKRTERR